MDRIPGSGPEGTYVQAGYRDEVLSLAGSRCGVGEGMGLQAASQVLVGLG